MSNYLEASWYKKPSLMNYLLLPLTAVFWLISALRRSLYSLGILRAYKSPVPVIVVGNISVGGNGKTPMVIYLANYLQSQGKKVGVISRGYGAKPAAFPFLVTPNANPVHSADEPLLIAKRTGCPVMISPNRQHSIERLINEHEVEVIISDDGLQHYALARDIELCIVEQQRQFGNGWLLPAGPLRERPTRAKKADLIIYNGNDNDKSEQPAYQLVATGLYQVSSNQPLNAPYPKGLAMSAIANPSRFEKSLKETGVNITATKHFRDHYFFQPSDFTPENSVFYMTEKDAVKCGEIAPKNSYYLQVEAQPNAVLQQALAQLFIQKGIN